MQQESVSIRCRLQGRDAERVVGFVRLMSDGEAESFETIHVAINVNVNVQLFYITPHKLMPTNTTRPIIVVTGANG